MNPDTSQAMAAFGAGDFALARSLAEQALASGPSPLMDHVIGLIDCGLGDLDSGIGRLRRALEAEPSNPRYRTMLARALIENRRPDEALAVTSEAAGQPGQMELAATHAEAAQACGRFDLAADTWSAIADIAPNDPRVWTNLGRAELGRNRFAEAEAAYRRSLALTPDDLGTLYELGLTLERTNQLDALSELLDESAKRGIGQPQLPELWALRELRSGRPLDALEQLRRMPNGANAVHWNHLRAKAADASGEAAEAFAAAEAMNRATPDLQQWRGRAAEYRGGLRRLAAAITPEWADGLRRLEPSSAAKLGFLVGFPRSGTTLTDTFLMGHPDCRVIEEQPLLFGAAERLGALWSLDDCSTDPLLQARDAYRAALDGLIAPGFAGLVIDKFPLNLVAAPLICSLFPGAPILFVQRHPCDAVLSAFMQSFAPNLGMASFLDLADAADFYDAAMSVWFASTAALPLHALTLVYEELVRDPEAALRPALEFLGLPWDDRLLDHRATARARGTLDNTSYNQVTEALTARASGRWKRYEAELAPVLPVLLPWAERLGYAD